MAKINLSAGFLIQQMRAATEKLGTLRLRVPRARGDYIRVLNPGLVLSAQAMSTRRLDSVSAYSRARFGLHVRCAMCRHTVVLNPSEMFRICLRRGWSDQMANLVPRLRCSRCGARGPRYGPGAQA